MSHDLKVCLRVEPINKEYCLDIQGLQAVVSVSPDTWKERGEKDDDFMAKEAPYKYGRCIALLPLILK